VRVVDATRSIALVEQQVQGILASLLGPPVAGHSRP